MACGSGRLLADLMAKKKPQISAEGLDISRYGNNPGVRKACQSSASSPMSA
jgi:D-amino-acid dehydrogenase